MPKKAQELSALEIKEITKEGRYAVGSVAGLLLVVKENSRSWILRTMVGKKRRNIGLGPYPEVKLAQARKKANEMKEQIENGIDPVEQRKSNRAALIASQDGKITFIKAARICHEKKQTEFKNVKHSKQWISSLEKYVFPIIGRMSVDEIDVPYILQVLEPIWQEKTETATRVRQRIEAVLSWATASEYREGDNPAKWQGNLDAILPKPNKIRKVKHHAALSYKEINSFITELKKQKSIAARCLEFLIYTACRSGEIRGATWEEFDFENKIWTIPEERMKAGKPHRVPLTDDMIQLLNNLPRFEDSAFLFPGARGGPLSDMALSMLCRRMNVEAVPHGFRSTFRDWAAECTNFPREVCEQALAHTIPSAVEAAYRRGDL